MPQCAKILRFGSWPWGTLGRLRLPDGWECWTVERPWLANKRNVSCIPDGVYALGRTLHYGGDGPGGRPDYACYEIKGVPGRDAIHVHIGNVMQDVQGCVVVGAFWVLTPRGPGVAKSRETFGELMERLDAGQDWELRVQWVAEAPH